MKFLYDKNAGNESLKIVNEAYLHIKARRMQAGERIRVRNLKSIFMKLMRLIGEVRA